jgi:hypothetical protein
MATGVAARVIGMRRGDGNVARLFVAAPRRRASAHLPCRSRSVPREILRSGRGDELLVEIERELLGFDHADVGTL